MDIYISTKDHMDGYFKKNQLFININDILMPLNRKYWETGDKVLTGFPVWASFTKGNFKLLEPDK